MAITMPPFLLPATTCCNFWGFPLLSWPKQAFIFLVVFLSDFNSLSLAPSLLPIPLSWEILVIVLPLSHLLASLLTIFSQPGVAIWRLIFLALGPVSFFFSSTLDIGHTNAQLFALQFRPALEGFVNAYSSQECSYCPVSYFELVRLWGVLLRGNSKYQCYYAEKG